MSSQNLNLFFALHHWARRQDENFTTEALFSVIRLLQRRCSDAATDILNILTHGAITAQDKADLLVVETQVYTQEGTPDAKITGQGIEVLLEVKVTAEIRTRQLEAYLKLIESSHAPVARLVLLSHYPPISTNLPEDVVTVRWYEIGECLEQLLCKQLAIDPICHHYVEEFLDFLCLRGLASTPVKTTLSAALTAYRAKTGGLPLYNYRFRSLESLNQYEELEPLVSLLKLMDMAIQSLVVCQM